MSSHSPTAAAGRDPHAVHFDRHVGRRPRIFKTLHRGRISPLRVSAKPPTTSSRLSTPPEKNRRKRVRRRHISDARVRHITICFLLWPVPSSAKTPRVSKWPVLSRRLNSYVSSRIPKPHFFGIRFLAVYRPPQASACAALAFPYPFGHHKPRVCHFQLCELRRG